MDMGRLWADSAGFELGLRGFERVLIDLAGFEMFCGIWMIWVDLIRF